MHEAAAAQQHVGRLPAMPASPPSHSHCAISRSVALEVVEGKRQAKGNVFAARLSRRSRRAYDMGTALDGIRQTARGRRDVKFSGLLHHIYAPERLRAA